MGDLPVVASLGARPTQTEFRDGRHRVLADSATVEMACVARCTESCACFELCRLNTIPLPVLLSFRLPFPGLRSSMFRPPLPARSTQGKTRRSHIESTAFRCKIFLYTQCRGTIGGCLGLFCSTVAQRRTRLGGSARASYNCFLKAHLSISLLASVARYSCRRSSEVDTAEGSL